MFNNLIRFLLAQRHYLWGILYIFASIFIFISLYSYNYQDSSLNRAGNYPTSNLAGELGAYLADPMLQIFGIANIMWIICFLCWGLIFIIDEKVRFWALRLISLIIAIFSLTILSSYLTPQTEIFLSGTGGYVGEFLKLKFAKYISYNIMPYVSAVIFIFSSYFALSISNRRWKIIFSKILNLLLVIKRIILFAFKIFSFKKNKEYAEDSDLYDDLIEPRMAEQPSKKMKILASKPKSNIEAAPIKSLKSGFILPSVNLLKNITDTKNKQLFTPASLKQSKDELLATLMDFGIKGDIKDIHTGPVVTLYELEPAAGTKSSRVIGLSDDIARSMKAHSARIAVIPGQNALGIELPNKKREMIFLRELLESSAYKDKSYLLPIILGKDISGRPIVADLAKMPHLLVAGTTGSGKSVSINTMLLSLLYTLTPDQCKLILIDPKMLELSIYDDIPHLLTPVVTEPKKAIAALKWVVKEMEERYRLMSNLGVRNIAGYNERITEARKNKTDLYRNVQTGFDRETGRPIIEKVPMPTTDLPYIVVIVDEMADLMIVAGKEIETSIQRLSQMARAAGIHIIMATQRPSVDVITGVIKANFPTRISFHVTSRIDSRTILGEQGAEQLLGMGDLLYLGNGSKITRIHGPFVSDEEVRDIVAHLKQQGHPQYIDNVTIDPEELGENSGGSEGFDADDELYQKALELVTREKKASTSYIQRFLRIGYNRAASIMDRMEKEGVVTPANHVGKREVLI